MKHLYFIFLTLLFSTNIGLTESVYEPIQESLSEAFSQSAVAASWESSTGSHEQWRVPGSLFKEAYSSESSETHSIKADGYRAHSYFFTRPLSSLNEIGASDEHNQQLQNQMKSLQAETFVTVAQTQPAAAAGQHYAAVNAQLTLINQQLADDRFLKNLDFHPGAQEAVRNMYTGCLTNYMKKQNAQLPNAYMVCSGDSGAAGTQSGGANGEVAKAKDSKDHSDNNEPATIDANPNNKTTKLFCSHYIFEQQSKNAKDPSKVKQEMDDFIKTFGDEYVDITSVTKGGSPVGHAGGSTVAPTEPIMKKFEELVKERFRAFDALMNQYCTDQEQQANSSSTKPSDLLKLNNGNIWSRGALDEYVALLSTHGMPFNTILAEAMYKTYSDIARNKENNQLNCALLSTDCNSIYGGTSSGPLKYNQEQANTKATAPLCRNMYAYAENIAMGFLAEALMRQEKILEDFTLSAGGSSIGYTCGKKLLHAQIGTEYFEDLQTQMIVNITGIVSDVITQRSLESGKSGQTGAGITSRSMENQTSN